MRYQHKNAVNRPRNFSLFWLLIQYMRYELVYNIYFNSVYGLVYIWWMLGIQKWPNMWPWLKKSHHTFLILVYAWHTKNWYMTGYKAFFIIPQVCSIPEATRNDYFWLVTAGIRLCGIHIMTFVALSPIVISGKSKASSTIKSWINQDFNSLYSLSTACKIN